MNFTKAFTFFLCICVLCTYVFPYASAQEVDPTTPSVPVDVVFDPQPQIVVEDPDDTGASVSTETPVADESGATTGVDTAASFEDATLDHTATTEDILSPEGAVPDAVDPAAQHNALEIAEAEVKQATMVAEMAVATQSNEGLPFRLMSTTTFGVALVPEFLFALEKKSVVEEVVSDIRTFVSDTYEGSLVENVVDVIVEVVSDAAASVVEFVAPEADAQELEQLPVDQSDAIEIVQVAQEPEQQNEVVVPTENFAGTSADTGSSSTEVSLLKEDDTLGTKEALSTSTLPVVVPPVPPFAVVDGEVLPIVLSSTEDGFMVRLEARAFGVGIHTLSIHLILDEALYVYNTTFTVSGTVLSQLPLLGTQTAEIIADTMGVRSLWLVTYATGTAISYDKLYEFPDSAVTPVLSFEEGSILWKSDEAVLVGIGLNSKSFFSQTLNTNSRSEDELHLSEGTFVVEDIDGAVSLITKSTEN